MRTPALFKMACIAALALAIPSAAHAAAPVANSAATCRRAALELAGTWAKDGFRVRGSTWTGTLPAGAPALVRVNLVAGNRYWFSAATNAASTTLTVRIFTARGEAVAVQSHADGPLAAAGFAPAEGGTYLVSISEAAGTPVPFCAVISYK